MCALIAVRRWRQLQETCVNHSLRVNASKSVFNNGSGVGSRDGNHEKRAAFAALFEEPMIFLSCSPASQRGLDARVRLDGLVPRMMAVTESIGVYVSPRIFDLVTKREEGLVCFLGQVRGVAR